MLKNNSVCTVTRLRVGRRGFDSHRGRDFFSSPPHSERLWGPPSHLSNGYCGYFLDAKAAGAWSWPLISICVVVKNEWSFTSTHPYVYMARCL